MAIRFIGLGSVTTTAFAERDAVYSLAGQLVARVDGRGNVFDLSNRYVGLLLRDGRVARDPASLPPLPATAFEDVPGRREPPAEVPRMSALARLPRPYIDATLPSSPPAPACAQASPRLARFLLHALTMALPALLAPYLLSAVLQSGDLWADGVGRLLVAGLLCLAILVGIAAGMLLRRSIRSRVGRVIVVGPESVQELARAELERPGKRSVRVVEWFFDARAGSDAAKRCASLLQSGLVDRVLFHSCSCGAVYDRDVNAAKIILARGLARLAGGIPSLSA
jgi:hypothetical protein